MSVSQGNQVSLVKVSDGWEAQSGPFTELLYRGTETGIAGKLGELGSPSSYVRDHNGPAWELRVRYADNSGTTGDPEIPTREERLHWNRPTQSIFKDPRWATITDAEMAALRKALDERVELGALSVRTFQSPPFDASGQGFTTTFSTLGKTLYSLMLAGVESSIVYQPVVIVTQTASAAFAWTMNFNHYGWLFDTVSMRADAGLTAGWAGNLPEETSPKTGFIFAWLKSPPELNTVAGNKTQLVQEYEYGLWPEILFTDKIF